MPESTDHRPRRIYLTEGSNLVGVDPLTGRVKATASGSAVNGSAEVYAVRDGVALGLDQGGSGDAWGYDLAAQRVTLAAAGLPWPHYFVDLSDVGGSADPASGLVIIAACTQPAPSSPTQPSDVRPDRVDSVRVRVRPAGIHLPADRVAVDEPVRLPIIRPIPVAGHIRAFGVSGSSGPVGFGWFHAEPRHQPVGLGRGGPGLPAPRAGRARFVALSCST